MENSVFIFIFIVLHFHALKYERHATNESPELEYFTGLACIGPETTEKKIRNNIQLIAETIWTR